MKQQLKEHSVVIGAQETVLQTISKDKIAAATAILRDKLYTNKLKAAITEPLCNAIDEHRKNGIKRPVDVFLLHDEIVIRDYANGLSDDVAYKVFFQYLETTKDDTDAQIGGFGLGAKAPGAYSDNYTVESIYQGKKTTFWSRVDGDVNLVSKIDSRDTDLPSGIAVHIPLAGENEEKMMMEFDEAIKILFDLHTIIGKNDTPDFRVITSPSCDSCSPAWMYKLGGNYYSYNEYGTLKASNYEELARLSWSDVEQTGMCNGLVDISKAFAWVCSRMMFRELTPERYYSIDGIDPVFDKYEEMYTYRWNPASCRLVGKEARVSRSPRPTTSGYYCSSHLEDPDKVQTFEYACKKHTNTNISKRIYYPAYNMYGIHIYDMFLSDFFAESARRYCVYDGDLIYMIESTPATSELLNTLKNKNSTGKYFIFELDRERVIVNQNRETASFTQATGAVIKQMLLDVGVKLSTIANTYNNNTYKNLLDSHKKHDPDFGPNSKMYYYTDVVVDAIYILDSHRNELFNSMLNTCKSVDDAYMRKHAPDNAVINNALFGSNTLTFSVQNEYATDSNKMSVWVKKVKAEGCRQEPTSSGFTGAILSTLFYTCEDVPLLRKLARCERIKQSFNIDYLTDLITRARLFVCSRATLESILAANDIYSKLFPNICNLPLAREIPKEDLEEEEKNIPKPTRKKAHVQDVEELIALDGSTFIPKSEYSKTMIFSMNEARDAKYGTFLERLYTVRNTRIYNSFSIEGDLLPLVGIRHLAAVPKKSFKKFADEGCIIATEFDIFEAVKKQLSDKIIVSDTMYELGASLGVPNEEICKLLLPDNLHTLSWTMWTKYKALLYMAGDSISGRNLVGQFEARKTHVGRLVENLLSATADFKLSLPVDLALATLSPYTVARDLQSNLHGYCSTTADELATRIKVVFDKRLEKVRKDYLKLVKKHRFKSIPEIK